MAGGRPGWPAVGRRRCRQGSETCYPTCDSVAAHGRTARQVCCSEPSLNTLTVCTSSSAFNYSLCLKWSKPPLIWRVRCCWELVYPQTTNYRWPRGSRGRAQRMKGGRRSEQPQCKRDCREVAAGALFVVLQGPARSVLPARVRARRGEIRVRFESSQPPKPQDGLLLGRAAVLDRYSEAPHLSSLPP